MSAQRHSDDRFVAGVMSMVATAAPPSAPRSFVGALRDRSAGEAVGALGVAAHLAVRGRRIPLAVRAQALALVAVVALLAGSGATLAATAVVHLAVPLVSADRTDAQRAAPAPTAPAPTPTAAPIPPRPPTVPAAVPGTIATSESAANAEHRPYPRVRPDDGGTSGEGDRPATGDDRDARREDGASGGTGDQPGATDRPEATDGHADGSDGGGGSGDDRGDDSVGDHHDGGDRAASPTATPEPYATPEPEDTPEPDGTPGTDGSGGAGD